MYLISPFPKYNFKKFKTHHEGRKNIFLSLQAVDGITTFIFKNSQGKKKSDEWPEKLSDHWPRAEIRTHWGQGRKSWPQDKFEPLKGACDHEWNSFVKVFFNKILLNNTPLLYTFGAFTWISFKIVKKNGSKKQRKKKKNGRSSFHRGLLLRKTLSIVFSTQTSILSTHDVSSTIFGFCFVDFEYQRARK